jgi:hypothetical protein
MDYKSKRLSIYSSVLYVAMLAVSAAMTWLGIDTFFIARQLDMKIVGLALAILGVVLVLCCLLALWILVTEAIGFEANPDGSIFLRRLWLKPLARVQQIRLLIKLGCVLRADGSKGECVPYVVLRADRMVVPMPAEIYSRLDSTFRTRDRAVP